MTFKPHHPPQDRDKSALKAACVSAAGYLYSGSFVQPAKEISALARDLYREVTTPHWETGEQADEKEDATVKINWPAVFVAVVSTFFTHQMSVRLANGTLTASVGGTPVHLTANLVLVAAALAYEGVAASIQSGVVLVTFTPNHILA